MSQVELYAKYEPQRLMGFLISSQSYGLEAAHELCKRKGLIREQVFVLGRMGNAHEALHLIVQHLADIPQVDILKVCGFYQVKGTLRLPDHEDACNVIYTAGGGTCYLLTGYRLLAIPRGQLIWPIHIYRSKSVRNVDHRGNNFFSWCFMQAIEFVQMQQDDELWDLLITLALSQAPLTGLLSHINLLQNLDEIPTYGVESLWVMSYRHALLISEEFRINLEISKMPEFPSKLAALNL